MSEEVDVDLVRHIGKLSRIELTDEEVEVVFNHPMAVHTVVFEVEILGVVPAEAVEE